MPFEPFQPEAPADQKSAKTWSILYVEDEDTNWEVTEFALRSHHQLERARSDREAFARLRRNNYDLILMDIQLAGSKLNGIEITRVLRGTFVGELPDYAKSIHLGPTPIVFVTAYASAYRRDDLLKMGGNETIYKPVDFVRLQLMLSRLLMRRLDEEAAG